MENIDPELMKLLVELDDDEVIVPLKMKREDVGKTKAVRLSDEEKVLVEKLQAFLYDRHYINENTFAALFVYLFNLGYTCHQQLAAEEARQEKEVT